MPPIISYLTIGEAMEIFRKDKGWSMAQMAEFLGIARSHYYRILQPNANPRLRTVYKALRKIVTIEAKITCDKREDHHWHLGPPPNFEAQ